MSASGESGYFDTSKDFRILLAEKGLDELEKLFNSVKIQGRKEYVRKLRVLKSDLQTVKYSYISLKEITELEVLKKIIEVSESILKDLKGVERDFVTISVIYWLEYMTNLPKLLSRGIISQPYQAIRYFCGEIVSRSKIDKLWICTVDCGFKMNVVTNSGRFKQGEFAIIAHLPPRVLEGNVSEGMFLDLSAKCKEHKGETEFIEGVDYGEVNSILVNLLK
jgi:hypothetical protein